MRRAVLIAILILASCGGEDQPTDSQGPAPTLTTAAAVTTLPPRSGDPETVEQDSDAVTSTTTTTTTITLPPNAIAEFALSQVVFGDAAFVIITNWGNATGSLDGLWLSQGSALQALPDVSLAPAEQALIGLAGEAPSDLTGMAAVVDLGRAIGEVNAATGEVALHRSDAFDDPDSLIAYVAWGDGPHPRIDQAVSAGLWDETPVAVLDDAPSISTGVYPATMSIDWAADIGG